MAARRRVEVFNAGCPACTDATDLVRRLACDSCEVVVLDMTDRAVAARARQVGVRTVPAVVVDGRLADCCAGRGPDEAALRAAGLGQPLAGAS
jgi:glutaredoxin